MSGARSRRKGHNFERVCARLFREVFPGEDVRRGLQSREGHEVPDVECPRFWVECKVGKQTNPRAALAQAVAAMRDSDRWPVAICKDDRQEPFVIMRLDNFLELVKQWWRAQRDE